MVIFTPEQITPAWLTERLASRGILHSGAVTHITVTDQSSRQGTFGNIASLDVTYTADTVGSVPRSLFLKTSKADLHPELLAFGEREVYFYADIAEFTASLPIPRCYDAAYDATSGHSHILVQDLSATHYQTVYPIPPSPRQCELLIRSLAQVHALFWNSPLFSQDLGHLSETFSATATRRRLEATLPGFLEFLGDSLLPAQQRIYQDILAAPLLSRREERRERLAAVTLTHGDAHPWSFMLPRDPEADQVMVIDWHLWEISPPTDDLAYLMAYWWGPSRRAMLERSLLETYHQQLVECGVEQYDWDMFQRDYRESVAFITLIPIGQFRRKVNPAVMWNGLENSTAAFQDWNCAEGFVGHGIRPATYSSNEYVLNVTYEMPIWAGVGAGRT